MKTKLTIEVKVNVAAIITAISGFVFIAFFIYSSF